MSLKFLVLAVLSRQSATGYEITKTFDAAVGSFWRASHQQVYRELNSLSRIGLTTFTKISQTERPDKKVYTITQAGTEDLLQWLTRPTLERPMKDDLLIKVWAGELLGANALRREIARLRTSHEAELQRYKELEAEYSSASPDNVFGVLRHIAIRRGVTAEQCWISWANEADAILQALEEDQGATH
jgi:PadR family transcriptional regulator, regulatory protein AphA